MDRGNSTRASAGCPLSIYPTTPTTLNCTGFKHMCKPANTSQGVVLSIPGCPIHVS